MVPTLCGKTNSSQSYKGHAFNHIRNQIGCECLRAIPEVGECGLFEGGVVIVMIGDISVIDVNVQADIVIGVAVVDTVAVTKDEGGGVVFDIVSDGRDEVLSASFAVDDI